MRPSTIKLVKQLFKTTNPVTKWVLRNIIIKRIETGEYT